MTTLNTREHLIKTGLESIHSNGYTATGVKEILDRAGVPKGSFYHYFPSKQAFAEEVLKRYGEGEYQRWTRILGDQKQPPLKRLRQYFDELVAVYGQKGPIRGCLLGNLSLEVADHSPALQSLLRASFGTWQQAIVELLQAAVEKNDLPASTKPNDLSWEGALVRSKAEKSDEPLDNFIYFAFNVLLRK
jgi:TetR/AcrR family transcriptional regulator, transcriptional repressor for nem operon